MFLVEDTVIVGYGWASPNNAYKLLSKTFRTLRTLNQWNTMTFQCWLLFTWRKGHGSGCTNSPQRNAPRSLPCVLSNTARLLVQWQHTIPAQLNGETDNKTVPASKTKGKRAGNTPNIVHCWSSSMLTVHCWSSSSNSFYVHYDLKKVHVYSKKCVVEIHKLIICNRTSCLRKSCTLFRLNKI